MACRYTVAYCIADILDSELNEFKNEWNVHKIRANSKTALPSGIPNDLYEMPHTYGSYSMSVLYTQQIYI